MIRFDVLEAGNLLETCSLLAEHKEEAKLIAGGQNLLVLLRHRLIRSRYLISIKRRGRAPAGMRAKQKLGYHRG